MNTQAQNTTPPKKELVFSKDNYKWMFIGLGVIFIGFLLMLGGGSDDPTVFNEEEMFSFRRIILSPIVILTGFGIEVYAIMKKS